MMVEKIQLNNLHDVARSAAGSLCDDFATKISLLCSFKQQETRSLQSIEKRRALTFW